MEARAVVEPAYPILQTGTSPLRHLAQCLAGEAGVEPATCRFRAGRSAN